MLESKANEFEQKQRAYMKVYAVLCLIVLLSLSAYIFIKGSEYLIIREAVKESSELTDVLKGKVVVEKAAYDTNKQSFDEIAAEIEKKLKSIFPDGDDYTDLTRQIDKVEEELNRLNDPFEISNIDYMSISEEENVAILPLRMNIRSSAENFRKFLHKIENSGALNETLRIMDIPSIRLSFAEIETEGSVDKMINFSVLINAYFQK